MGKAELDEVNDDFKVAMRDDGYGDIYRYQPYSELYWKLRPRIAVCNSEAYEKEYEDVGIEKLFDFEHLMKIKNYNHIHRYISSFTSALLDGIGGEEISPSSIRSLFNSELRFYETMRRIAYFNMRKEIGLNVEEDRGAVYRFYDKNDIRISYRKKLERYVAALEFDILVIGGVTATNILGDLLGLKDLNQNCVVFDRKRIVVSMRHFSRMDYNLAYGRIATTIGLYRGLVDA